MINSFLAFLITSIVICVSLLIFAGTFNIVLKISTNNSLATLKSISLNQIIIGFYYSLILHFLIFSIFSVIYMLLKVTNHNSKLFNNVFNLLNIFFMPSFLSFWLLLSFNNEVFSLISTIIATAALLIESDKTKKFIIFPISDNDHQTKK